MCIRDSRWTCSKSTCRTYKQLRSDTWFEGAKLPFRTILLLIYAWTQQYASIKFCEKELKMSHSSRVDWANFWREVCASHLLQNPKKIGGPNMTVEVDETLISRRKTIKGVSTHSSGYLEGTTGRQRRVFFAL